MTRPDFVARRLAHQLWGNVQSCAKLDNGIWLFETEGHGGIVVDIEIRPELKDFQTTIYNKRYGKNAVLYGEQHFAAFEEDCDAQMVEWTYPSISAKIASNAGLKEESVLAEWMKERRQILEQSLRKWHPEWVNTHPYAWGQEATKK